MRMDSVTVSFRLVGMFLALGVLQAGPATRACGETPRSWRFEKQFVASSNRLLELGVTRSVRVPTEAELRDFQKLADAKSYFDGKLPPVPPDQALDKRFLEAVDDLSAVVEVVYEMSMGNDKVTIERSWRAWTSKTANPSTPFAILDAKLVDDSLVVLERCAKSVILIQFENISNPKLVKRGLSRVIWDGYISGSERGEIDIVDRETVRFRVGNEEAWLKTESVKTK